MKERSSDLSGRRDGIEERRLELFTDIQAFLPAVNLHHRRGANMSCIYSRFD